MHHVASLDGTAPGPGPTFAPGLSSPDGTIEEFTGDPYTLTGNGVSLAAPVVARKNGFTLYRTPTGWALLDAERNVYPDGQGVNTIGYAYFPKGGPGVLTIDLSRTAYNNTAAPPGRATIQVGTVKLNQYGGPELGRVLSVHHATVVNGQEITVPIRVARTPVAVSIVVSPPYHAPPDPRLIAAQVGFRFVRDRSAAGG